MPRLPYHYRARRRALKFAISANATLEHEGNDHDAVIEYLKDMARHLSSQQPNNKKATFYYIVRCMGELACTYSESAYGPYGYLNPFHPVPDETEEPLWRWPVVNEWPAGGNAGPGFGDGFAAYSALKMFDYTVGKTNGWPTKKRQEFLSDFMEMELPSIVSRTFGDEYGTPKSAHRLQKVANVIATNASNFFRNDQHRYAQAIADWKADLRFLKKKYYEGQGLQFEWPSTR